MNDGIVIGSMVMIGLTGTTRALLAARSPFRPIVGALGALIVLGAVDTVAPQIARGLAILAAVSVMMVYAPDILALWNNSGERGGSGIGGIGGGQLPNDRPPPELNRR